MEDHLNSLIALLCKCKPPTPEETAEAAVSLYAYEGPLLSELLERAARWVNALMWCGVALCLKAMEKGHKVDDLPSTFKRCTVVVKQRNLFPPTVERCKEPPPRQYPPSPQPVRRSKLPRGFRAKGRRVEPPLPLATILQTIEKVVTPIAPIGKLRIAIYYTYPMPHHAAGWWVEVPGMHICEGGRLLRDALAKVRDRLLEIARYGEVGKPPQKLPPDAVRLHMGEVELRSDGSLHVTIFEDGEENGSKSTKQA